MILTAVNKDIPDWLRPYMKEFCDCGLPIADDGPIDAYGKMKLTQRWCMNLECPYHMANKIVMLAERFGVTGVGIKTAQDMAIGFKFKNHLEALRFWFPEKPKVYLYEVGEMAYIYGVKSIWKDLLGGYTSFEQFFAENPYCSVDEVRNNKDYLIKCEQFFDVKKETITNNVIRIMITGSIKGFSNRQDFLWAINDRYKDWFRVEDNKKTVRDTVCLVKEPGSVDYSKTQIAMNNNIPIMDSSEFIDMLESVKGELEQDANS